MADAPSRIVVAVHLHDDVAALRRSLPTAVHQQLPVPHEVLVVVDDDAGSGSRGALEELTGRYPDVTTVRLDGRRGRAAARQHVLDTVGDVAIAWMDPGDVWHPRKLAIQHATLLAADALDRTFVTCDRREVDLRTSSERVVAPDLDGDLLSGLVDRTLRVPLGTVLATAEAHRTLGGFDRRLAYRDDEELLLRLVLRGGGLFGSPGGPLVTGSVVRDRPTARAVIRADRRIRRTHGRSLRSHDRDAVRRAHRRELLRAARLATKEGAAATGAALGLRARAVGLVERLTGGRGRTTHDPGGAPATPPVPVDAGPPDVPVPAALIPIHEAADHDDFSAVVGHWSELDAASRSSADPVTIELVARSLRALGRHRDAMAAAERGLVRWPGHPRIEMELAKSRSLTTDWATAWRATTTTAPATGAGGMVTSLGVLAGDDGPVTGTLPPGTPPVPTQVTLFVDDLAVVTTAARASADPDQPRPFAISCGQLLEFLGDGDVLTVRADGVPLAVAGFGLAAEVRVGHPSRLAALRARLDGGAVFTKFGRLRPGYTPGRKRRTLDLVDEVAAVVADELGYGCTPFYGNLLGAVREQDFIAHDVGGFDLGYLSGATGPREVRDEFVRACLALLDRGFHLELEPFGALIRRQPGDRIFADLNYAWFGDDGTLQLSFGWRDEPVTDRSHVTAPRDTYLAGRLVPVPGAAEEILRQVYGAGWATPDQGFDLAHRLQREEAYLLDRADVDRIRASAPDRVVVLADEGA